VKRHRKKKIHSICIPELKEGLLGEGAQRLGKGCLLSILEPVNGLHKMSLIYAECPGFSEMPFFQKALGTGVVFSLPRNKGKAAF
jgi:hypothetical protein